MKGTVKQAFPFAFDGSNFLHLKVGDDFPPSGYSVQDTTFEGLKKAGFIEVATSKTVTPADEELNRRIIDALDKRLSAMSDEELKSVIVRRGTPFSGNMVHAVLVNEAKMQMLAEMEGRSEPVSGLDPNSGVTEQPLAAPGAPVPPAAATAVAQQQAQQDAAEQKSESVNQGGAGADEGNGEGDGKSENQSGENKATNQFGEPMPNASKPKLARDELAKMSKAELEAYAADQKIDLTGAKTKDDYLDAIEGKK